MGNAHGWKENNNFKNFEAQGFSNHENYAEVDNLNNICDKPYGPKVNDNKNYNDSNFPNQNLNIMAYNEPGRYDDWQSNEYHNFACYAGLTKYEENDFG